MTEEDQSPKTAPLHLFLLWPLPFGTKSSVKLRRWPLGAGAVVAAGLRYLTAVWLWGSQAYRILCLISPCLLSASMAASCHSDKLHGTLWRADHEPQGPHGGRSSRLLPASVSRGFISPNTVGNGAKLSKLLSLSAHVPPGNPLWPDLSPWLERTLRAGYWSLDLDTVIRGTLSLFFKLRAGGPIVSRLNTDVTSSALGSQLST